MKRVLITGSTGFVGANLARRLLSEGHELHLLVRPAHKPWRIESIRKDVHLHQVELTDADALAGMVGEIRPEWIFHLAAYGAYSSQGDVHQMVQTNIAGTINLLEACLKTGFESFINTGSSSEYGIKDHAPSETEIVEPNSNYAVTKVSATLFCRYKAQCHKMPVSTLRLYSVFGPYEDPARLVPTLIRRGLRGELPPLVDPDGAHDFVFIDDVLDAYLLAATVANQEFGAVYNIGTGVQTTMRDVVDIARRVLTISAKPKWGSMPNRVWDATVWVADNRKARTELHWQPRYSFEDGFRRTVDFFSAS